MWGIVNLVNVIIVTDITVKASVEAIQIAGYNLIYNNPLCNSIDRGEGGGRY